MVLVRMVPVLVHARKRTFSMTKTTISNTICWPFCRTSRKVRLKNTDISRTPGLYYASYTNKGNFKQHVEKHFKNGEFQANGPEMVNGKTNGYGKKIIYFDNSQIPFKFHKHSFLLIN